MVNKEKRKGTDWERQFVELILNRIEKSKAKRIAGSGAIGTILDEPLLTGDVILEFPAFPKKFRVECKVGYGGSKQLTVKKEWFDKIIEEAKSSYSIPLIACKFLGAKENGVKYFLALDIDTFCDIINWINELKHELDLHYESMASD